VDPLIKVAEECKLTCWIVCRLMLPHKDPSYPTSEIAEHSILCGRMMPDPSESEGCLKD
jgi:hypothetical protein